MKYLGIDYGAKTLGIAISDAEGKFAFPRGGIASGGNAVAKICDMVKAEAAEAVVMGDTRALSGAENPITREAEIFADTLVSAGIRVERVWEAWSSVEAARFAPKGKKHEDAAAAAVILQRYLDTRKKD